ncbi:hypothetical protein A4A49_57319 [Nicotiana attenuata]|uniref:Uncharacterized protein n=1 Tax=Nicotiana attenuata TaxID=49451 RepID=A0A1J6KDU3_NICAT|nr:hypothetical protein A4A49_57319 [Nicotiana attenuata]
MANFFHQIQPTSVRDAVQVEKTGGSRDPVVPDRDMNSKGEAAGVYVDLEAGQPGKGSDQLEPQNTNLITTGTGQNTIAQGQKIAVVSSVGTILVFAALARVSTELNPVTVPASDRASAGVTKGPGDKQKSDEVGHQTVNANLENKTDAPELNKIIDRVVSKIDKPTAANIKSAGLQAGATDALNEGVKSDNIVDKKDENWTMVSSKTGSPNNRKVQQLEQKQGVVNRSSNKRRSSGVKEQATTPKNIEFSNSFDALSNEQEQVKNKERKSIQQVMMHESVLNDIATTKQQCDREAASISGMPKSPGSPEQQLLSKHTGLEE